MGRLFRNAGWVALLLLVEAHPATGQGGTLVVEPELIETRYCGDDSGTLVLRATVRFSYRNRSQVSILLPRFAQISQYSLFADEESLLANRPEHQERYRVRRLFDISRLDRNKPDQHLFDFMEPGASRARVLEIVIFLRHPNRTGVALLGKDEYLRVEINQWFGSLETGEDLRQRWRDVGALWIENVVSTPLRLHIEEDPVPRRCPVRID
jgi:hypothetical protein